VRLPALSLKTLPYIPRLLFSKGVPTTTLPPAPRPRWHGPLRTMSTRPQHPRPPPRPTLVAALPYKCPYGSLKRYLPFPQRPALVTHAFARSPAPLSRPRPRWRPSALPSGSFNRYNISIYCLIHPSRHSSQLLLDLPADTFATRFCASTSSAVRRYTVFWIQIQYILLPCGETSPSPRGTGLPSSTSLPRTN
jgi:hypothetical protein